MKAYRLLHWQQPPKFQEVATPVPSTGEVLIRVGAVGLCRSDLHLMDWAANVLPYEPPFTLGHETAGWVKAIGDGVSGIKIGEAVAVYGIWGCGSCPPCRRGTENYCDNVGKLRGAGGGLGKDGGLAHFMLVPSARYLVPLGDLSVRDAAPLTDAGLSAYHVIRRSLPVLHPGAIAVVIGIGGVGHMALQLLRLLMPEVRVIAVDVSNEKLRFAMELGAHDTVLSGESAADEIHKMTNGYGAQLVLDMVGSPRTIVLAASVVRRQGEVAIVGHAGGAYPFSMFSVPPGCSFSFPHFGTLPELVELVRLARSGAFRARAEYWRFDDVPEVYARLRNGLVLGRAVVEVHNS